MIVGVFLSGSLKYDDMKTLPAMVACVAVSTDENRKNFNFSANFGNSREILCIQYEKNSDFSSPLNHIITQVHYIFHALINLVITVNATSTAGNLKENLVKP